MTFNSNTSKYLKNENEVIFSENPNVLLPPANVVCEGYVFTPVCDFVNGGGLGSPPGKDTPTNQTPPRDQTPQTRPPPGPDTPDYFFIFLKFFFLHTVNTRAVRIILECILVKEFIFPKTA